MLATRMIKTASITRKVTGFYKELTPGEKFFGGTAAVLGVGGAINQSQTKSSASHKTTNRLTPKLNSTGDKI